ncbi:unnamed protein product [Schistosoma curassoni]|uniref:V-type ATP synthase subunit D n=1 Tax=Schistosoma curassoni TaxID=6186 RepID=A0A183JC90_9TREM|nr:unnamed protein product [Schistosoma curassoni]
MNKKAKEQAEYTEANKQAVKSIRDDKQKHLEEIALTVEKASREGNMRQLFAQRKNWNWWVECFEKLLNRPALLNPLEIKAALTDLPTDVTLPMIGEIRITMRQIKNGKGEGPDNIPEEALNRQLIPYVTNGFHSH